MFPSHFQNAPPPPGSHSHAKFYSCSEHPDVPSFRKDSKSWKCHLNCGCANAAPSIIRPLPLPSSGVDPVTHAANLCSPSACSMINTIEVYEKILRCHLTVDKGSDFLQGKLALLSELKVTKTNHSSRGAQFFTYHAYLLVERSCSRNSKRSAAIP